MALPRRAYRRLGAKSQSTPEPTISTDFHAPEWTNHHGENLRPQRPTGRADTSLAVRIVRNYGVSRTHRTELEGRLLPRCCHDREHAPGTSRRLRGALPRAEQATRCSTSRPAGLTTRRGQASSPGCGLGSAAVEPDAERRIDARDAYASLRVEVPVRREGLLEHALAPPIGSMVVKSDSGLYPGPAARAWLDER
jgi:hypothetical protein